MTMYPSSIFIIPVPGHLQRGDSMAVFFKRRGLAPVTEVTVSITGNSYDGSLNGVQINGVNYYADGTTVTADSGSLAVIKAFGNSSAQISLNGSVVASGVGNVTYNLTLKKNTTVNFNIAYMPSVYTSVVTISEV